MIFRSRLSLCPVIQQPAVDQMVNLSLLSHLHVKMKPFSFLFKYPNKVHLELDFLQLKEVTSLYATTVGPRRIWSVVKSLLQLYATGHKTVVIFTVMVSWWKIAHIIFMHWPHHCEIQCLTAEKWLNVQFLWQCPVQLNFTQQKQQT